MGWTKDRARLCLPSEIHEVTAKHFTGAVQNNNGGIMAWNSDVIKQNQHIKSKSMLFYESEKVKKKLLKNNFRVVVQMSHFLFLCLCPLLLMPLSPIQTDATDQTEQKL